MPLHTLSNTLFLRGPLLHILRTSKDNDRWPSLDTRKCCELELLQDGYPDEQENLERLPHQDAIKPRLLSRNYHALTGVVNEACRNFWGALIRSHTPLHW